MRYFWVIDLHPLDDRYGRERMRSLFSEEAKIKRWLQIETALANAHAQVGNFSPEIAREISSRARIHVVSLPEVKKAEEKTG